MDSQEDQLHASAYIGTGFQASTSTDIANTLTEEQRAYINAQHTKQLEEVQTRIRQDADEQTARAIREAEHRIQAEADRNLSILREEMLRQNEEHLQQTERRAFGHASNDREELHRDLRNVREPSHEERLAASRPGKRPERAPFNPSYEPAMAGPSRTHGTDSTNPGPTLGVPEPVIGNSTPGI